jgi:hypothetical protein
MSGSEPTASPNPKVSSDPNSLRQLSSHLLFGTHRDLFELPFEALTMAVSKRRWD